MFSTREVVIKSMVAAHISNDPDVCPEIRWVWPQGGYLISWLAPDGMVEKVNIVSIPPFGEWEDAEGDKVGVDCKLDIDYKSESLDLDDESVPQEVDK